MGAVLVHIDAPGDRPHPSSLAALAAGRALASSWGATLYAAVVTHDPAPPAPAADATARVVSAARVSGLDALQAALARGGADKVVIALTDAPVAPLWASVGGAWQGVVDQLRPRLVLFGADAPSALDLAPRTGARLGARLLRRARVVGEAPGALALRDRDGGHARDDDGGAAVVLVGGRVAHPACDDSVDLLVLALPGGRDARIELAEVAPAEAADSLGVVIALGDDAAREPGVAAAAARLGAVLGAPVLGTAAAARAGAVRPEAVVERAAALAPELAILVGAAAVDLAGATSLVRVGSPAGRGAEAALPGPAAEHLAALAAALEAR